MTKSVFIDGEAGTTGLQIRERLAGRADIRLLNIDPDKRKDVRARGELLNEADAVVLCLPDDAAKEAVALIKNPAVKVVDASTAHRTASGWTYGLPELSPGHRAQVATSLRISNPGCYPTGFIALVAPLVRAGLLPRQALISCNAVSGYSGGGKAMIAEFEDPAAPNHTAAAFRIYALGLGHKHVPEMQTFASLAHAPIFAPAVGRYRQGMIVEVPLHLAQTNSATLEAIHFVLATAYLHETFVEVADLVEARALKTLDPESLNGTNRLKLFVFGDEKAGHARLVALLDNLGKGAAGAAVQNLNLALGLPETAGLI